MTLFQSGFSESAQVTVERLCFEQKPHCFCSTIKWQPEKQLDHFAMDWNFRCALQFRVYFVVFECQIAGLWWIYPDSLLISNFIQGFLVPNWAFSTNLITNLRRTSSLIKILLLVFVLRQINFLFNKKNLLHSWGLTVSNDLFPFVVAVLLLIDYPHDVFFSHSSFSCPFNT